MAMAGQGERQRSDSCITSCFLMEDERPCWAGWPSC